MKISVVLFSVACVSVLAGCGNKDTWPHSTRSAIPLKLNGRVFGGQQPVSGASIQLYEVALSGDRAAAIPLLSSAVSSDILGNFNITGKYICPDQNTLVYLAAVGGDPGLGGGAQNNSLALMAMLGYCGDLTPDSFIVVNELTTVASVLSLSTHIQTVSEVSSTTAEFPSLISAFLQEAYLVDQATGTSPGRTIPAGYTAPVVTLNTLADAIAACVNSIGGVAGDGSPCGNLFIAVTPPGGAYPTDTVGALVMLSHTPALDTSGIFGLVQPNSPFQPALTSPPSVWSLSLESVAGIGMPERAKLLGEYLLTEGQGLKAGDTSGNGNDASISGPSWEGNIDLNFTAPGEFLQLPNALNTTKTWQFAIYNPPFGSNSYPLAPGYGSPLNFGFNPTLLAGTDGDHLTLGGNSTGGTGYRFFAVRTDGTESAQFFPPGWHVFTLVCGSSSMKSHYLYDGTEVSAYLIQGAANTCGHPSGGNYQIGGSSFYPYGTWFVGKLGAAWSWSIPLTETEAGDASRAALAFLRSKGVPQAYRKASVAGPQIIAGLDSRTVGAGLTPDEAWPSRLVVDPGYMVNNLGVVGQLVIDGCTQFDLTYGTQLTGTFPAIVILWGGVNDFAYSNQTALQIADNLKCMVQKAKAAGAQVILATEISSTTNNTYQGDPKKNALNPLLRNEAFSWGVDDIADLAEEPILGEDGASQNTNCFQDAVHPTSYCQGVIAQLMSNAVNELLGSSAASPKTVGTPTYTETAGDRFVVLSGSMPQTITLPSCVGFSLPRQVINLGVNTASIITKNGETLTGPNTMLPQVTRLFNPVPGPLSLGGCTWNAY